MAVATSPSPDGVDFSRWALKLAGSFAVIDNVTGKVVTPRSRKARGIIVYLASRVNARVSRERLAGMFWGDRGESQARASLRQALLEIRHAAAGPPALIESDREHLWINRDHVEIQKLSLAAFDNGGWVPFEDLGHITPEFDEWLDLERAHRIRELREELRAATEECLATDNWAPAVSMIEAMNQIDPFDEDALRLAMRADFHAGHVASIEQRYQEKAAFFREELGVEPSAESKSMRNELTKQPRSEDHIGESGVQAMRVASTRTTGFPKPAMARPYARLRTIPRRTLALLFLLLTMLIAGATALLAG